MTSTLKSRIFNLALVALAATGASACKPETKTFGGTITGTVLDQGAQPAGFVTVYVADPNTGMKEKEVDGLSGTSGRFRLEVPKGTWTLIATDFMGTAAFVYEVSVGNGDLVDVGNVFLEPCAVPGSGSNGDIYAECPDPSADDFGYGAPPGPFALETYEPEYTEATLSYDGASVSAYTYSSAQGVQINFEIAATSPFFQVGQHTITGASPEFFAVLWSFENNCYYVAQSGVFEVVENAGTAGGAFSVRLLGAEFDWYDNQAAMTDPSFTAVIGDTEPAISATIAAGAPPEDPANEPPPDSYTFGTLAPDFTEVYVNPDGSLEVVSYDDFGTGEYVYIGLSIPASMNAAGSYTFENLFAGAMEDWQITLRGYAEYGDIAGHRYGYVLVSGTLGVTDAVTGEGDVFSGTLDGASFQWQMDPVTTPYSTLTLEFGSSGTITGAAMPMDEGEVGGSLDWDGLKGGLLVNLGG